MERRYPSLMMLRGSNATVANEQSWRSTDSYTRRIEGRFKRGARQMIELARRLGIHPKNPKTLERAREKSGIMTSKGRLTTGRIVEKLGLS